MTLKKKTFVVFDLVGVPVAGCVLPLRELGQGVEALRLRALRGLEEEEIYQQKFEFMTQKDTFLRPFTPVFYVVFLSFSFPFFIFIPKSYFFPQ